ncbi:MAG: DUF5011 domain-containing protein [Lachnospiraceae bacterium]|nr:DUF5011 domain-containing protein [Lachnospiraceae bacterium]
MKNSFFNILKIIIAAAAITNLIILFLFEYGLPAPVEPTIEPGAIERLGPAITLPDTFPQMSDLEIQNIKEILIRTGRFKAVDEDGSDITDKVICDYSFDENDERIAFCSFSVTGQSGKTANVQATVKVTLNRPIILLSTQAVQLKMNEVFSPMTFVNEALDAAGNSIIQNTIVIGQVNTSSAGVYHITYQAKDAEGFVSDPKTLTVTVR